jgi:hypothetical protein
MAATQIYPTLDASIEACFPNQKYDSLQPPQPHKEIIIQNRFKRRESESPNLWPVYELYVRHPQVPNFFLLPTYYKKTLPVVHHPPSSWTTPCACRNYHPSPCHASPQQPPQTLTPSRRNLRPHEKTPTANKSTRSKRKYDELFNAEQFLNERKELSVFLDFDNI